MRNTNWLPSGRPPRPLSAVLITSSRRRMQRRFVTVACALMLLALALLLSACTPLQPMPCEPQPLPTMPALTEPLPLETYSKKVQTDMQSWAKKLTGTPATLKP